MTMRASLGGVSIGDGLPVSVMGALNVSPESFYSGSVVAGRDRLLKAGELMLASGAALLDVGAMSTAPYLSTAISVAEETDRLGAAVEVLVGALGATVSADTSRAGPARAALEAGARVINDVRGLTGDPGLAPLVAASGAGLIVMASERGGGPSAPSRQGRQRAPAGAPPSAGASANSRARRDAEPGRDGGGAHGADRHDGRRAERGEAPIGVVRALLAESLALAAGAGIGAGRIAVDPGIGFFRRRAVPSHEWDCGVLASLSDLTVLGRPVCVGVSRKSFIGALAGASDPAERLPGSLAAAAVAVLLGAHLVRCHDVAETVQAVRVAEALRAARP